MGETEGSRYTPAGKLANKTFLSAVLEPELYPAGTAFLPSDAPDFAEMLALNVREHRPIAVIYPDGRQVVATPTAGALAVLFAGLLTWLSARKERRRVESPVTEQGDSHPVALPRDYQVEFREREPVTA